MVPLGLRKETLRGRLPPLADHDQTARRPLCSALGQGHQKETLREPRQTARRLKLLGPLEVPAAAEQRAFLERVHRKETLLQPRAGQTATPGQEAVLVGLLLTPPVGRMGYPVEPGKGSQPALQAGP